MGTTRAGSVRARARLAPRWLAALGVLTAAVLALSTVVTAPRAEAATVLGQFRNAAGRCLENLNNATTTNNKIQIAVCGAASNQAQQFSRWPNDEAIKTPAGRCLGTQNNGTAAGTSVVLQTCAPTNNSQRWVVRTDGLIVNRAAVRCLAPLNNSATAGTRMVLATCTTSTAMRWTVPAASTPTAPTTTTTPPTTTTTTTPPTTTTQPPTTTAPPTTTTTTLPPTTPPSTTTTTTTPPSTRDPLRQPFASSSIWNMPIGSDAVYVPANLPALPGGSTGARVPQVDDEPLVLTPTAPLTPIHFSSGGWGGNRCQYDSSRVLATAPIPAGYVLPSDNKNQSAAILAADGRTVVSPQPLARCTAGGPATSYVRYPDQDIYGPGVEGSHGGSGMSALGGSIRLGELRPGQQGPRHALKVNLYNRAELSICSTRPECFRWPAVKSDSGAVERYGRANNNTNRAMRMGTLLAIPANVSIASLGLTTEPGRQIAWTLQNYGAYVVDDTNGPSFAFNAEVGPAGSMRTQFRNDYNTDFEVYASSPTAWSRDVQKIRQVLAAVDNNGPNSVGGGGTPRQPLLPELVEPLASVPPTVPTAPATTATSGPVPATSTPAIPDN